MTKERRRPRPGRNHTNHTNHWHQTPTKSFWIMDLLGAQQSVYYPTEEGFIHFVLWTFPSCRNTKLNELENVWSIIILFCVLLWIAANHWLHKLFWRFSRDARYYVCPLLEFPFPGGLETSGQRVYRLYWHIFRRVFSSVLNIFCAVKHFLGPCEPAYCA